MLINKIKSLLFTAIYAIIRPEAVFADMYTLQNPINAGSFAEVVQKIAQLMTQIGLPIAAIFLVWSGFLFVSARGDEKKLETAKSAFYWTVIGTALIVVAYAIATAIVNFAQQL